MDQEVIEAMELYEKWCKKNGVIYDYPSSSDSELVWLEDDRKYVILRNVNGILAVYSVDQYGHLMKLKNIPDIILKDEANS